jgi:hypothetical protein
MSVAGRCTWCGKPAYGTVTARGLPAPLYDCESGDCWERSYQTVKGIVPRTWKLVDGRGRRKRPQPGPDLFDQLREDRP